MNRCILLSLVAATSAAVWSYDRCLETGPSAWADQGECAGEENSPINVCGAVPANLPEFVLSHWDTNRSLTIKNNGHAVQVGVTTDPPTTRVGNLSSVVGRSPNSSTPEWQLEQLHFHWGREDGEGSEHFLNGVQYPLEGHFVHFNTAHGASVTEAATSGAKDALLVVGVLFDLQGSGVEPETLSTIASNIEGVEVGPYGPMTKNVTFSDMFDGTGSYASYAGGLTTPGCNEVVTWVVMETPKKVTPETLALFKAAPTSSAGHFISEWGNYRPLQPIGVRMVYTSGNTSIPCEEAGEASFVCAPAEGAPSAA